MNVMMTAYTLGKAALPSPYTGSAGGPTPHPCHIPDSENLKRAQ